MSVLVPFEAVRVRIVTVRQTRVLLGPELAALYGVEHRSLMQAVRRNQERFPPDFLFVLTGAEWRAVQQARARAHPEAQDTRWGGTRRPPWAFTGQGVAMLSSVLRSRRAIEVNIEIMRAFVHLRQWLLSNRALGLRLAALEKRYDQKFKLVFEAIEELAEPPASPPRRRLGFAVTPSLPEGRRRKAPGRGS